MTQQQKKFDAWLDGIIADIDTEIAEIMAEFEAWYLKAEAEGYFDILDLYTAEDERTGTR
ncbi:MAG: hypothetical protein IJ181_10000 [Acidaminococcaceae bacterium]|nr:hypothetical protein [Acidaminococcaceae bacterium]